MHYVGIDVHSKQSTIAVLSPGVSKPRVRTVHGGPKAVATALKGIEGPFSVCFEASTGYGAWCEALTPLADTVTVAHPGHLRLIYGSKRKNDRVDAVKLARLLSVDAVPGVHVPNLQVREWRGLIRYRQRKVQQRTALKCAIRALLRENVVTGPPHVRSPWTKAGKVWLAQLELPRLARLRMDEMLDDLSVLDRRIKRVTAELDAIARKHPGVALLKTIPGVGNRTAEAFVAWVDEARRFARSSQIGAYFGVVPCQDQSAGRNRLGHITRNGPSVVRALLVEAAWMGVRRNKRIRAKFEQFTHGDPDRRKIAIVATAHWLARVMLSMLKTGEVWRGEN